MNRRNFLVRTGLLLSTGMLAAPLPESGALAEVSAPSDLTDWDAVRAQFKLTRERIHMAGFLLASHPQPVRDAIERHRRGLDENPADYLYDNSVRLEGAVLRAAADYFGVQPTEIALTESMTTGLGLLYGGLKVRADQEILTTTHDHYSTAMALQLRAARTGAALRQIPLYQQLATVSQEEIVETLGWPKWDMSRCTRLARRTCLPGLSVSKSRAYVPRRWLLAYTSVGSLPVSLPTLRAMHGWLRAC